MTLGGSGPGTAPVTRAWEQLCFQLRPPAPPDTKTIKTGDPDAGLEWYVSFPDGNQHGWQAKYSDDPELLIGLMPQSLVTVVTKRPEVDKLTFCVPIDLPAGRDRPGARRRTRSARQRFEDAVVRWRGDIPGMTRSRRLLFPRAITLFDEERQRV